MAYSITFYISDKDVMKAIKKFGSLEKFKEKVKENALELIKND